MVFVARAAISCAELPRTHSRSVRTFHRGSDSHNHRSAQLRTSGTVKWFNGAKGYGFIAREEGEDVFVHYSSIRGQGFRNLEEGQSVEFELQQDPKGWRAADVVVVGW